MAAGRYDTRFAWFRRTRSGQDEYGEPTYLYTFAQYLWGFVDAPSSSDEERYSSDMNVTRGVIACRQFPAISKGDYLQDVEWQDIYRVTSVRRNSPGNEVLADVESLGDANPPVFNWRQDMSGGVGL